MVADSAIPQPNPSVRTPTAWTAADEATTRIGAVRKVLQSDTASETQGAEERDLRQGLSELDAVRQFLHEQINTTNQRFLSSGDRDESLHTALQHGLAELEDVRSKLVRTLSGSLAAATRVAATRRPGGEEQPKIATEEGHKEAGLASDQNGKRVIRGQRPASATVRLTSKSVNTSESIHGTFDGLRSTSTRINARPVSATRRGEPSAASGTTRVPEPTKPLIPTGGIRPRPMTAGLGKQAPPPTPGDAAESAETPAHQHWAKYQDWAQKVMTSVQGRRVTKLRQALEKERSSDTAAATTASSSSTTAQHTGTAVPVSSGTPETAASVRPLSAAFSGLRRAQHAAAQQTAATRPASATVTRGGLDTGAQAFREQGNVAFQQRKFSEAADLYSRALALEPHSELLFCNRAAAHLMMSKFHSALADAQSAIDIDPSNVKAHWRAAKSCLYLGQTDQARSYYAHAQKLADGENDKEAIAAEAKAADLLDKCRRCIRLREYTDALKAADQIIEIFPPNGPCTVTWLCLRAEVLLHIDPSEALSQATKYCNDDPTFAEAWFLRAKAVFYTSHDAASTNLSVTFLRKCRELDIKHVRAPVLQASIETFAALRDQGNSGYAAGRWQEAYVAYTKCLAVDPYNTSLKAIILCNRSAVCIQCERWKDALDDITQSIMCNPQNAKAYTRRARILQQQGSLDAAIKDLQLAVQMYPSAENQERLQQAIEARNRQNRPGNGGTAQQSSFRFFGFAGSRPSTAGASRQGANSGNGRPQSATNQGRGSSNPYAVPKASPPGPTHYDVLGVSKAADEKAVTRAYRDAALKWHPDKWMTASPAEKTEAEEMFKRISTAYGTLRDAAKRRQYDLSL